MAGIGRAWAVAASVGAVEALKDQLGICRWNYAMRSLLHHASTRIGAVSQAKHHQKVVSVFPKLRDERAKRTEEALGKVMHLSSWGPH